MNPKDIKDMTLQERIQTMEMLWDSLIENEANLPSPSWHEAVLDSRRKKMESGDARILTLDELKKFQSK